MTAAVGVAKETRSFYILEIVNQFLAGNPAPLQRATEVKANGAERNHKSFSAVSTAELQRCTRMS